MKELLIIDKHLDKFKSFTFSFCIQMIWVEVNFESSNAVVEGSMNEIADRVLHG